MAYGVFGSETKENWGWFMGNLAMAIGSPPRLVISTDAGKGIDIAVTNVFTNGVESSRRIYGQQQEFTGKICLTCTTIS